MASKNTINYDKYDNNGSNNKKNIVFYRAQKRCGRNKNDINRKGKKRTIKYDKIKYIKDKIEREREREIRWRPPSELIAIE